ncbi:MAG: TIGR03617 family F420-dependent LLM class oxidoreductase [Pseudomonadota bacterium]
MRIETLLPLGKVDPGLRQPERALDLKTVGPQAQRVEALGYDAMMIEETKVDPYIVAGIALSATAKLTVGSAVAIAFPRSPTVTAMSAWNLQHLSAGRFILGLGSQVRGHIQRRYGFKWSAPGPWMREYVEAVKAVWNSWQTRAPLDFRGEHYQLDLIVPLFDPGPIEHPNIPIHLAAVNAYMCQVAGEVANGVRPHPVCSPAYIRDVMRPAVEKGAAIAGRSLEGFAISIKPLIATAKSEEKLVEKIRDVRARISFYASTPAYRAAFDHHGLGDLADDLKNYSKAQRWEEMPHLINDEVLDLFATIGTFDEIADKLHARYGEVVTNAEFSIPVDDKADEETLAELVAMLQSKS